MKHRQGFVSNSSSSSFILDKHYLSACQVDRIKEFINSDECEDSWNISEEDDNIISLWTSMDNGDLMGFIRALNPPMLAIREEY